MTAKKKPAREANEGYLTMRQLITSGDIAEAQSFYSDDLAEEDEQGANRALAEYLRSTPDKGGRFVAAMLNRTVRSACHYEALHGSLPDKEETCLDVGGGELANLTAQMVFELDTNLEHMAADPALRVSLLKKVEKALDGFLDENNPERGLLAVYATCVERLARLAREDSASGNARQYAAWLKKCVHAGRLLVKSESESERYHQALAYFLDSLGETMKGAKARECYLESLEEFLKLRDMGVECDALLNDISVCYDKLGNADAKKSPAQAREWYLKCLGLRAQLIASNGDAWQEGMFATPLKKLMALNIKAEVPFFEQLLEIAGKAADAAPDDTELQLLVNMIVSELLKMTKYAVNESSCSWQEIEARALERVVAKDTTESRYFWWLSDSYRSQAEYHAKTSPEMALSLYFKCLDNSEKVIELDGERLCYSCGLRSRLLEIDQLVEQHFPESRNGWYKRWLSIAQSCRSLCDPQQMVEHKVDIDDLKKKLKQVLD